MYSIQKVFTVLILIFISVAANGQISKNDSITETTQKTKIIKMPKYPIADFPKKSMAVSNIEVIQLVRDSLRLGYVLKGLANQVAEIKTEKPLTAFLQDHIIKMYKNDYKKEGSKLLWVIKDLRIGERVNFSEYSYLKFKADSYISSANNKYSLVLKIDTIFLNESGGDVTAWHGQQVEDALKLLLKQTLKNATIINRSDTAYSFEEIKTISVPFINVPILMDTNYTDGAYKNFEEFLQNKPSLFVYKPQVYYDGKSKFITGFTDGNNKSINIWGVCKNGEVYKYADRQLVPIEKLGNGFIVSFYAERANKRNKGLFLGGLIGGVAGGLVGGATGSLISLSTAHKMLLVTSIPYITKSKKQPEASIINMETGELAF